MCQITERIESSESRAQSRGNKVTLTKTKSDRSETSLEWIVRGSCRLTITGTVKRTSRKKKLKR